MIWVKMLTNQLFYVSAAVFVKTMTFLSAGLDSKVFVMFAGIGEYLMVAHVFPEDGNVG